jgi:hypothetical protein
LGSIRRMLSTTDSSSASGTAHPRRTFTQLQHSRLAMHQRRKNSHARRLAQRSLLRQYFATTPDGKARKAVLGPPSPGRPCGNDA